MAVQTLNFALSEAITGRVLAAASAWGAGMEFGKVLLLLDEQFSISRLLSHTLPWLPFWQQNVEFPVGSAFFS